MEPVHRFAGLTGTRRGGNVTPTVQYFPDHEKVRASVMGAQPPVIMQLMTT